MDSRKLKLLFVFIAVYALLFALSHATPLRAWDFTGGLSKLDYALFLLPVAGFFFVYMVLPWVREELGFGEYFYYFFPVLFGAASFLAFIVAVYYFFGNQAFLSNVDISAFQLDYFDLFVDSAFIYFVLAGIGGWGARVLIENFEGQNEE